MKNVRIDLLLLIIVLAVYATALWYGLKAWRVRRGAERAATTEGQLRQAKADYVAGRLSATEHEQRIQDIFDLERQKEKV